METVKGHGYFLLQELCVLFYLQICAIGVLYLGL